MNVTAYKTHKITVKDEIFRILDKYLPKLENNSVVAIASKIVGICEGRVVPLAKDKDAQKTKLAKEESDYYLPREFNQYNFMITVNNNILVASAGIDESNSGGYLSLWPKDPQKSANAIREYLVKKTGISQIGIIITDSKLTPLRTGVTGVSVAHSGFAALNSYVGIKDIFGKEMRVEKSNIADSLATAAVAEMGEGNEQQPLAVITDVPYVTFQKRNPTVDELKALQISMDEDVYASLLTSVTWEKGKGK